MQSLAELEYAESSFFKFMVVRDPFERLHSCYRDKMVDNPHWSLSNFRKAVKDRWGRRSRKPSLRAQNMLLWVVSLGSGNHQRYQPTLLLGIFTSG